ncbi:hypothetical protein PROFUN_09371 [Planoprotostelium fungivorum]|uniref:Major facilitator superfamily (MFS) profile domain-containing protein n=1 Tax=Planoprotostelium fungivorum TaxID=1890364 RepID=A0A2P6NGX8_9EUKA|nr:hypothetical protein PROFUN_09371 [Planoprotostelium fungivorum]
MILDLSKDMCSLHCCFAKEKSFRAKKSHLSNFFGTLGDDFYKKLNSRSNLALILGVLKRYRSAEESDDQYTMHLWSQIDPIPNVAYKPCLLATTPNLKTTLPVVLIGIVTHHTTHPILAKILFCHVLSIGEQVLCIWTQVNRSQLTSLFTLYTGLLHTSFCNPQISPNKSIVDDNALSNDIIPPVREVSSPPITEEVPSEGRKRPQQNVEEELPARKERSWSNPYQLTHMCLKEESVVKKAAPVDKVGKITTAAATPVCPSTIPPKHPLEGGQRESTPDLPLGAPLIYALCRFIVCDVSLTCIFLVKTGHMAYAVERSLDFEQGWVRGAVALGCVLTDKNTNPKVGAGRSMPEADSIELPPLNERGDADMENVQSVRIHPEPSRSPVNEPTVVKYITWADGDKENPFEWSNTRKKAISFVSVGMTFVVSICSGGYASAEGSISEEFAVSQTVSLLGLTLCVLLRTSTSADHRVRFIVGFAFCPLLFAPMSEVYGRSPIYFVTFLLFGVFSIPIAVAQNIETVLISRFLQGCLGSTAATMVGGTLADIWHADERGAYMSIYTATAFVGTATGPIISGFLVYYRNWRWVFYIQILLCGLQYILMIIFLRETRGSVLLSRRAKKLRETTGDQSIKAPADDERQSIPTLIRVSLTRPIHLLFREPIVIFFTIWLSFVWAILYLCLESIPLVLVTSHGFNEWQVGLSFLGLFVGAIVAALLNPIQDGLYRRAKEKNNGVAVPEARLYSSCVGTILFTGGLFWFGWTSFPHNHFLLPIFASAVFTCGMYQIYLATFNYIADSYKRYAASALAAVGFVRNMLASSFPLFSNQMFINLHFQWASTLLGCIALVLSAIPFILIYFGPKIRASSKFAREVADDQNKTVPLHQRA